MAISPIDNVGKKNLPSFPWDQNNRRPSVLVLPVVVGGEVVGYLPAAATDKGNGTAQLKVDTELTLNADVVNIGNLKVGSTDGVQADTFLLTDADGTLHVAVDSIVETDVNVKDWGGTPQTGADLTPLFQHLDVDLSTVATEATLADVKTDLDSILAQLDVALSTRASESTLVDVKTDLDSALTKLDSIITNTADLDMNTDELEAKVQSVRDQLDVLLSTRASEATLADVKTDLDSILTELDVALSTRASEATLLDVKSDLDMLTAVDYATETTLAGIKSQTDLFTFTDGRLKVDAAITFEASDIEIGAVEIKDGSTDQRATVNVDGEVQVRDDDANTTLSTIAGLDFATETTLASILAELDVALSTRASEATLADIKTDADTLAGTVVDGRVQVDAEFTTGDIEIGAVEIKDGETDQRAVVTGDGELRIRDQAVLTTQTDGTQQTRITDGATVAGVTLLNELKVRDADANTTLLTISGLDFATETTLAAIKTQTDKLTFDAASDLLVQEAQLATATVAAVDVDDSVAPATLILSANADRKEYTVVHEDPSATIYIGFADTVTTLTGIPIVGNQMYGSNKYTGDIYAVASVPGPISVRIAEVA